MKNVLILFGCASHRQGPRAIAQAQSLGLDVILVDTHENLANMSARALPQVSAYAVKSKNYDECLPQIKTLCATFPVVGIYTFEEYSVETCSQLCATFGFAHNSMDAILRVRNKNLCRRILAEHGLPQPESRIFNGLEPAEDFLNARAPADWILKPIDAPGSQGVSRITHNSIRDLHRAFSRLMPDQQQQFLIERFIEGREFSLEGYFHYGKAVFQGITEKSLKSRDAFVEDMHVFPAVLPAETRDGVYALAEQALKCIGLTFGHFHLEFWLAGESIIIGEMHGRPGGDYIHLLTEVATGIPTYAAVFEQYLPLSSRSNAAPPAIAYSCATAVKYFDAPEGKLEAIHGLENVRQNTQVLLTELMVKPGDTLVPCTDSGKRTGCVVVREATSDKARQTAMEMAAHVHFDTV